MNAEDTLSGTVILMNKLFDDKIALSRSPDQAKACNENRTVYSYSKARPHISTPSLPASFVIDELFLPHIVYTYYNSIAD